MRRLSIVILVACCVTVGVSAPALSQDYGFSYGNAPALHDWQGLYGGAHLGGAWGSSSATNSGGVNTLTDYWSAAPSGVVAGVQLGYNWLNGPLLYGVEGDLGYLGLAGSATTTYVPLGYDTSTQTNSGFYMTLRGRLGVVFNQWAVYATGGYIGADTKVSIVEACDGVFCGPFSVSGSNSSFRNGWTLGGGIEGDLGGPWTAKVEYLYYDLGSRNVTTNANGIINTWDVQTDGSLVRAGLNYKFGTPN